ncbi:AI-2E family transporter YdiK [Caldimonas sp. KR1-144]|uniref:AI-2E family transporter YdiK n=1 Tax=Caldimonas sp. KR1-144 TaxID=3400911 RepID=UPI003C2DA5EB
MPPSDLTKTTLNVLIIGALLAATLWILRPFVGAAIWAAMIVVATWPMLTWFQQRLRGSRALAVAAMTLLLILLFVLPLTVAVATVVDYGPQITEWVKALPGLQLPAPPDWLARLPFVGERIAQAWIQIVDGGIAELIVRLQPYARQVGTWLVSEAGTVGALLLQSVLIVVIAALMYAGGERAAAGVRRLGHRLGGERGDHAVRLAAGAIRGVALGVGVTALTQSVLGGIGLAIAGVPLAGLLTAVMLLLCIVQVGPTLVLAPAVVWVFWSGSTGWGIFLLVWTLIVGTMDNFLRPVLIQRGANLPLLLIFAGVIGGLLGFGLVGIFVGPVVLAVTYKLLNAWIDDAPAPVGAEGLPDERG